MPGAAERCGGDHPADATQQRRPLGPSRGSDDTTDAARKVAFTVAKPGYRHRPWPASRASAPRSSRPCAPGHTSTSTATDPTRRSGGTRRRPRPSWRSSSPPSPSCRSGCSPSANGPLLVVLQAMDAGGKDGVIRSVLTGINPAGLRGAQLRGAERRPSWPTTTCGGSTTSCPSGGGSGSSTAATTRTCSSCASRSSSRRRAGVAATATSATSSGCSSTRARPSSSCSCTSPRRSSEPACRIASTAPTSGGSSAAATSTTAARWDDYMAAYRDALARDVDCRTRRGTSCRATASGCATSPWRRILRDALERLDPQYPDARGPGIEGLGRRGD